MTEHDDKYTPGERLGAIFGLLADNEAPVGPRPDLNEIQAWHNGKLDESRAAEIKTHVARDPECFAIWSELLATQDDMVEQAAETSHRPILFLDKIKRFFIAPIPKWVGGGIATTMAILLVVLMLPTQQDWSPIDDPVLTDEKAQWPYLGRSITRGGSLNYRHKVALQAGISQGILLSTQGKHDWSKVLDYLHDKPQVCANEKEKQLCEKQTQLLQKTGLHASVLYLACLEHENVTTKSFDDSFWKKQTRAWRKIADELTTNQLQSVSEFAYELNRFADNRDEQCKTVRRLINLAY